MITLDADREEFAAKRRELQNELVKRLQGVIGATFGKGDIENLDKAIEKIFAEIYTSQTDQPMRRQPLNSLRTTVRRTLGRATEEPNIRLTALMVANAIINSATVAAADAEPGGLVLEWVTMHDADVRPAHQDTDGQKRPPGTPFDVAGHEMRYPGDPTAPIELWANCRCVLKPAQASLRAGMLMIPDSLTYSGSQTQGVTMTTTETEKVPEVPADEAEAPVEDVAGVPWHGVLAPEGVMSGDKRRFTNLGRTRDLPLPMTWQELSADGHDQSIVVAKIEKVQMIDGLMHASGHFLSSVEEADEVIGLIGEFGRFGVSVDADDVGELTFNEEDESATFDDPRICSASIVPIPAFMEAWVALGEHPILDAEDEAIAASITYVAAGEFRDVSKDERDRRADDGTAMPDGSYPIANCGDLKNAIQAIGRAKDPEATKRHIKKRYNALDCPDVDLPDGWSAETEDFSDIEQFIDVAPGRTEDGPGWLTHPVDTDRLRDYWVRGPGAAKIGWGSPGDFNRCRMNVAEYVKPQHLNGYCANRHYDALGFWPGQHHAAKDSLEFTEQSPAINLVAAAVPKAPAAWFKDPEFAEGDGRLVQYTDRSWGCPQTITEEGEVYGHIARWGTCHIGLGGKCVTAPPSKSNYDYFAMGEVITDEGPVRVGQLTIDTGHADEKASLRVAAAHYDDTGSVWADVAVGEDAYGIWYHGWVRPGTSEETIYKARASGQLSGDWRGLSSDDLEMVAALSVNVPGFPTPRPKVALVAGAQVSLIAAGMVPPKPEKESSVQITALASAIVDEMDNRKKRAAKMAALKEKYIPEEAE